MLDYWTELRREDERQAALADLREAEEIYCFVCSRLTDHFAEHDDLVEAGLAKYGEDGSVYRVGNW